MGRFFEVSNWLWPERGIDAPESLIAGLQHPLEMSCDDTRRRQRVGFTFFGCALVVSPGEQYGQGSDGAKEQYAECDGGRGRSNSGLDR
jgi:hypothetical protein